MGDYKDNLKFISFFLTLFILFISTTTSAQNLLEKGMAEFKAENYEEALGYFEKAYKDNPKNPGITLYLGLTHREMQDYPEAVRFFKETINLDPKAKDVKFLLSDVLFGMRGYEEALTIIESAINEGVRPAQSNYLKGLILLKLKKNMEAIEAFKKAKGLDPSLTQQVDFQIATAYIQEKEFKKAKEAFKGLITIDPTSDWALFSKDYLEALEKIPPPYRLNIGFGVQYDDNVLTNPIDPSFVDITKQEDWKWLYSLLGEYTFYSKGPWNIKASYALNISTHKENVYPKKADGEIIFNQDTVSQTLSLMPSYNTERGVTSLLLSYNYLEVDYARYKEAITINPSYTFVITGSHLGQVSVKYRRDEFDRDWNGKQFGSYPAQEEDRDANYSSLGLGYFYTFSKGNGLFNLKIEGDSNDTHGANWDYAGYKISTGLLYPFIDNRLKANIFLETYRQDFSIEHSIYNGLEVERRDATLTAQTALTYTIFKPLDISAGYTHIKNDSSIDVYEYKKNLYTVSFEYRF